jgi:predicted transcriptional regulator
LEDYVIGTAAAVTAASVVILATLLSRYTKMVDEVDKSTRLAKDVWDSANSRFSVVDARIIDLMAKTEVLSSRMGLSELVAPLVKPGPIEGGSAQTKVVNSSEVVRAVTVPSQRVEGTETEARVLRLLTQGPRTTAQIKEEIGKSREHTARLMKSLFNRGLVARNDRNKPYVYEITDGGKSYVSS